MEVRMNYPGMGVIGYLVALLLSGFLAKAQEDTHFSKYQLTEGSFSNLDDIFRILNAEGRPWRNFTYFSCSNADLTGSIPSEIYEMTQLYWLNLDFNELTGTIGSEIGSLNQMEWLQLAYNQLEGTIPEEIWAFEHLISLSLANNRLIGNLGFEIRDPPSLFSLDLSGNALTGPLHPKLFKNWTTLSSIRLNDNPFSGLMPAFDAGIEPLTRPEPGEEFTTSVSCAPSDGSSRSVLEALQYDEVARRRLPKASWIECDSAGLIGPIPSHLGQLTSLRNLFLDDNQLTGSLDVLGGLNQMSWLNLSQNKLSGKVPQSFERMTDLYFLDLRVNSLEGKFPNIFDEMNNLEYLYVKDNRFTGKMPNFYAETSDVSGGYSFGILPSVDNDLEKPLIAGGVFAFIVFIGLILSRHFDNKDEISIHPNEESTPVALVAEEEAENMAMEEAPVVAQSL